MLLIRLLKLPGTLSFIQIYEAQVSVCPSVVRKHWYFCLQIYTFLGTFP